MSKQLQQLKNVLDERGYILGLVMVFFVVFSISGMGFLEMARFEWLAGSKHYDNVKAFYNAEAGIHKALWLANKVSKAAATFSDATVAVVYDTVNSCIKATGISGNAQDSIKVTIESTGGGPVGGWPYVLYTNTAKLKLDEGTGAITGDVHSNDDVDTDSDYEIDGTITTSPYVAPPTIDWNFFKTEAQNASQYFTSTLTFTSAGSPYTGVWYTTSGADIQAGAVINGTVVAEGAIEFKGDNVTVTATPSNYPALLCQDHLKGGNKSNISVIGLIYSNKHFDKDGTNFTLEGAGIFLQDVHHSSTNFQAIYDATYATNIAGTNIGGSFSLPTVTMTKWEKL